MKRLQGVSTTSIKNGGQVVVLVNIDNGLAQVYMIITKTILKSVWFVHAVARSTPNASTKR